MAIRKGWTDGRSWEASVEGLAVRGRRGGPSGGAKVLLLHGWLDNAASFHRLLEAMPTGVEWAAPDLVGHGRSEGATRAYHFVDWVAVVVGILDALGWERCAVIGHSMGGAIAALVGGAFPERVEAMGWIDAIGPWSEEADAVVGRYRKALAEEARLKKSERGVYQDLEAMVRGMARSRGGLGLEAVAPMARRGGRRRDDERWEYGHDRMLQAASRIRLTETQVRRFLEAIEAPVWLVRPDQGWPVEEALIKERVELVERLQVSDVEGGHHIHLQDPEAVVRAMEGLWRQIGIK